MSKISTSTVADGAVRLISIDDGKANALSKEAIAELRSAIDDAAAADGIIAAVIAGRDGVFSGGFDLNVMRSGDMAAVVDLVADGGELVSHVYSCELPVVAACTGHALAAGALLLLGCDVRIGAVGDFKIGVNEVAIGMVLPDWGLTICRERLDPLHLQRAVANARITDAEAAVDVGFIDACVAPEDVVQRAIDEAVALAGLDRNAYAGTMRQFRGAIAARMIDQASADRAAV